MHGASRETFGAYLVEKYALPRGVRGAAGAQTGAPGSKPLRELWESTELSAADFADEIAHFFRLPRIGLPELLASEPQIDGFSKRFLRESMVFPFRANGDPKLAVADPLDTAAIRAAEIVFGGNVDLVIASFEDIATALERQDSGDAAETATREGSGGDDDIDNLRDLASGAPV